MNAANLTLNGHTLTDFQLAFLWDPECPFSNLQVANDDAMETKIGEMVKYQVNLYFHLCLLLVDTTAALLLAAAAVPS